MANDHKPPTFWGVWKVGLEVPELFASREQAAHRAYEMARLDVGITIHLLEMSSTGTVEFPDRPTAIGSLASYRPNLNRKSDA
jgi:hypothetical protein